MKTLWELAQSWEHDNTGTVFEPLHAPELCHRCQLEQWMREKAKEMRTGYDGAGRLGKEWRDAILSDLGVPEMGDK